MDLETAAQLGEMLGGLAIVFTLLFGLRQVVEVNRNRRYEISQTIANSLENPLVQRGFATFGSVVTKDATLEELMSLSREHKDATNAVVVLMANHAVMTFNRNLSFEIVYSFYKGYLSLIGPSMRRKARGREFRSNYHLNGTVEKVDISEEYAEVACRAARVLGLNVAGVDLLEGNDGPLVLEVNSSPGLEGIEKASGVNVAGAIIDYVIAESDFSEVNVDQLLKTIPGQGVLSVHLRNHPHLIGSPISEIFKGDIPVFALSRAGDLIWNPEPGMQLRFGDSLICYGDLEQLRANIKRKILDLPPVSKTESDEQDTNA